MGGRWNINIIRGLKEVLKTNDEVVITSSAVRGKLSTFKKYCGEEKLLVIFRGEGNALLQLYRVRKNDGNTHIQRIYGKMPPHLAPLSEGYSRCWRELPYVEKFLIFNEEECKNVR